MIDRKERVCPYHLDYTADPANGMIAVTTSGFEFANLLLSIINNLKCIDITPLLIFILKVLKVIVWAIALLYFKSSALYSFLLNQSDINRLLFYMQM